MDAFYWSRLQDLLDKQRSGAVLTAYERRRLAELESMAIAWHEREADRPDESGGRIAEPDDGTEQPYHISDASH